MMVFYIYLIVLLILIAGTIYDLKSREIPDWIYIVIVIFSLITKLLVVDGASVILSTLTIGLLFMIFMHFVYRFNWIGGGDAKVLMALGFFLPISSSWAINVLTFSSFLLSLYIMGVPYMLTYTLIFKEKDKFGEMPFFPVIMICYALQIYFLNYINLFNQIGF